MTTIRYALEPDGPSLRRLWDACFPQDTSFAPFFFSETYRPSQALVVECDEVIAAMLHMLPYTLRLPDGDKKASYIYAVGTHPDYRRRGFSSDLLDQALFEMHLRGVTYAMLIPAERRLFDFYAKFGFSAAFSHRPLRMTGVDFASLSRVGAFDIPELNRRYEKNLTGRAYVMRSEHDWLVLLGELARDGGGFALLPDDGYVAFTGKGTVLEGFGPGLVADGPVRPLGCARVVRARDAGWAGGVSDDWCPWNDNEQEPVLTPAEVVSRLMPADAYMNLMHN